MSLALFFGVLVLLLVLTVPICVSFAFDVASLHCGRQFPLYGGRCGPLHGEWFKQLPPACDSPVYHRWRDHGEGADF